MDEELITEKLKNEIEKVTKNYIRILGYTGTARVLEEVARSIRDYKGKYL